MQIKTWIKPFIFALILGFAISLVSRLEMLQDININTKLFGYLTALAGGYLLFKTKAQNHSPPEAKSLIRNRWVAIIILFGITILTFI